METKRVVTLRQLAAEAAEIAAKEGQAVGLVCRRCGCRDFRVYYTRGTRSGTIVRRRVCRHCGTMRTTIEKFA